MNIPLECHEKAVGTLYVYVVGIVWERYDNTMGPLRMKWERHGSTLRLVLEEYDNTLGMLWPCSLNAMGMP